MGEEVKQKKLLHLQIYTQGRGNTSTYVTPFFSFDKHILAFYFRLFSQNNIHRYN